MRMYSTRKRHNNENYGDLWFRPGSSFMVEMNIKKVLKKLNIEAEVEHSDLSSATPGAADVFVMAKDIAASASVPESQLVVINNIIDINELEAQLRAWFDKQ